MSDILIKNTKMPTSCAGCPIDSDSCELWTQLPVTLLSKVRHENCPLFPVLSHGRLIDADALKEFAYKRQEETGIAACLDVLDISLAPTIIPASEEETE